MSDPDRLAEIKAHRPSNWKDALAAVDWLVVEVERHRDLLTRLEWAGVHRWGYEENGCPICNADAELGRHDPGCELAAVLHPDPEQSP